MQTNTSVAASAVRNSLELAIAEPPEKVWKAFVEDTSRWWPAAKFCLAESAGVQIQPEVGGRVVERTLDGEEQLWFTVESVQPAKSIELEGQLNGQLGDLATTFIKIDLQPTEHGTLLRIHDSILAASSDVRLAWQSIFGEGLRDFIEAQSEDLNPDPQSRYSFFNAQ